MKLSKFDVAAIKNTAKSVKRFIDKKNSLKEKINKLESELEVVDSAIASWEKPITDLTGFTTEQLCTFEKNQKTGLYKVIVDESLLNDDLTPTETSTTAEQPAAEVSVSDEAPVDYFNNQNA